MRHQHYPEPVVMSKDALKYKGEWVAFSADYQRVVGHGFTPTDAVEMAERSNEPHAVLYFVSEEWLPFM